MKTHNLPNMHVFHWGAPVPDGFIRFSHDEDPLGGDPIQRSDFEILSHVHDGLPVAGTVPKMQRHPIESRLLKPNSGTTHRDRLSEIPVRLLGKNIETNLSGRFECFDTDSGRMVCVGNGDEAFRVSTEWEADAVGGQGGLPSSVPCEGPQRCPFARNAAVSCRFRVRLKLQIDTDDHGAADSPRADQEGTAAMDADRCQCEIPGLIESENSLANREHGGRAASASGSSLDPLALFEFQSGGINTYRALLGRLTMLHALYGDLRGLPLRLTSWPKSSMLSNYRVFHSASITLRDGMTIKEAGLHAARYRAEFNTDALDEVLNNHTSVGLLASTSVVSVVTPQRQSSPRVQDESASSSDVANPMAFEPIARAVHASMERAAQGVPVEQASEATPEVTMSPPPDLPPRGIPTGSTTPPPEEHPSVPAFVL